MTATPVRFAPFASERSRLLCWARCFRRLYGRWPDGVAPPEVQNTPQHKAAVAMLLGSHELRILVTAIDADGRPTFDLAPRNA